MTTERHAAAKLAAPTINLASVVYGLDAYMRSRGADAGEALRCAGLEPGDLTDPDRRVPLIRYLELLEICADLVADPQFGLKFGAQYEPRHAGVVGNVALASRTVSEAFEMIGRYLPTMVDATVHGVEVSDGIVFVYSYYIDPLMMSYRQKGDWAIAFACNLMRVGLGDPRWTPQEVLLPQLADETPAERRTRAEIMGDNIRVGHPWAGIRFDAGLLKRPMATADAMIEALMRHYGDLRLAALPEQRGEIEQLRREIARVLVKGEVGIERPRIAREVLGGRELQRVEEHRHDHDGAAFPCRPDQRPVAVVQRTEAHHDTELTHRASPVADDGTQVGSGLYELGHGRVPSARTSSNASAASGLSSPAASARSAVSRAIAM